VAIIEGRIVGCLMITYEWSDWRNGVQWWLQSVYVDSEYRRIGVFNRLYEFVKKQAFSKKYVTGIRLYVDKSNQKAMTTYKSLGMQPTNYLIYETSVQNT
jgi:ribosomal protein S18 acetylase RimI-like enzyme